MLDIVIPCLVSNTHLLPECLDLIYKGTDIPFNVHVVVDGGVRNDLVGLEKFLHAAEFPWFLLHNEKPEGLNRCLADGLKDCRMKLVTFIGPEVRLDDPKWVMKMRQVFEKDHTCGIVDTEPNTKFAMAHPFKRRLHHPPAAGCKFAMLQTTFAQKTPPIGEVDPCEFWSRQVMHGGGTSWSAMGVRYHLVECKPHPLWKELSGKGLPVSESPSPKTPASRSATTTTTAGVEASKS